MCGNCDSITTNARRSDADIQKLDPTRTMFIRKRFETQLRKGFLKLKGEIRKLIVDEDAFGLKKVNRTPFTTNVRWQFETDARKIQEFIEWIKSRSDLNILPTDFNNPESAYWEAFIREGYRKGAGSAFENVNKPFLNTDADGNISEFYNGTKEEFLRSSFASPASQDKLEQLVARTFTDLKNTTDAMAVTTSRALADGLSRGDNPWKIARELNNLVDKGFNASLRIARTEIVRAHAEGTLDSLENLGIEEVGVAVEWSTAGDTRVCPRCSAVEGVVLKIKEARGLIPMHPNCRCAFLPANVGEPVAGQIRTKLGIEKAFEKAIFREIPSKGRRTAAERRRLSRWLGADTTILKTRPKSILEK